MAKISRFSGLLLLLPPLLQRFTLTSQKPIKLTAMQAPASTYHSHIYRRTALGAGLALFSPWGAPTAQAQHPGFADETWQDTRRQRAVPVRIRWPQAAAPAALWPVVIYSHGLGGSRDGGDVWGSA